MEKPVCTRLDLPLGQHWKRSNPTTLIGPGYLRNHRLAAKLWGLMDLRQTIRRFPTLLGNGSSTLLQNPQVKRPGNEDCSTL